MKDGCGDPLWKFAKTRPHVAVRGVALEPVRTSFSALVAASLSMHLTLGFLNRPAQQGSLPST